MDRMNQEHIDAIEIDRIRTELGNHDQVTVIGLLAVLGVTDNVMNKRRAGEFLRILGWRRITIRDGKHTMKRWVQNGSKIIKNEKGWSE